MPDVDLAAVMAPGDFLQRVGDQLVGSTGPVGPPGPPSDFVGHGFKEVAASSAIGGAGIYNLAVVDDVPAVAYPTVMIATAFVAFMSDASQLKCLADILVTSTGTSGSTGGPAKSFEPAIWAFIPLMWQWTVPANAAPGYTVRINHQSGYTGIAYGSCRTSYSRHRA